MNIMNMGNRAAIKAWITALRSGEYEQSRGALRDTKGFCCMGVACDLVDKTLWTREGMEVDNYCYRDGERRVSVFPPQDVIEHLFGKRWAELRVYIAHLNDGQQLSFAQIADVLEATLINGKPWEEQPGYVAFAAMNNFEQDEGGLA